MAARKAQKAEVLTSEHALEFIARHGVVCESARCGAIPSLTEYITGEPVRGSWWSHPRSREIFAITRAVREIRQVLVCRIVDGKITYVHERLWPALVRLAARLPRERLARVREVHSESGKHVLEETPFPEWVPANVVNIAKRLREADALDQLRMLGEIENPLAQ